MLAEFIDRIISLSTPEIKKLNGRFYGNSDVKVIPELDDLPEQLRVHSLDSVVKLIDQEHTGLPSPLFISIQNYNLVSVFSDYNMNFIDDTPKYKRYNLCSSVCENVNVFDELVMEHEEAMINLRACFVQGEGTAYLLDLLSSVSEEEGVQQKDNGLTQTVTVKKGISLVERVGVKPRVLLAPYRTFREVEQPASEFLVRVLGGSRIMLKEADGGMWQLEAKRRIKAYFDEKLKDLIDEKKIVVMS